MARDAVRDLPASKIRAIANLGFGRADVLKFWFGESTRPTPDFIVEAGIAALRRNETFYTHNNGRADLREALAAYVARLQGVPIAVGQISVTSSGVSALMIAMQALLAPGDRVVMVTPVWPNVSQIPMILGAKVARVGLEARNGRWSLDRARLLDALTPGTRLLVINAPANPTGWMIDAADQAAILDHCRAHGIWILSDDVYERLVFDPALATAPSFLRLARPDDRIISANSFSKAWLMTGWRLGWLVAPPDLEEDLGKLIEFNTSCAPGFVQSAALAALTEGEATIADLRRDLTAKRDFLLARLRAMPGIEAPAPDGGMYAFFTVAGQTDSVALAGRLVIEAGLGLAPGAAFGPEGEGFLRWCFAAGEAELEAGLARLAAWLGDAR